METLRIQWIDTAKSIGMFFIVLGHLQPPFLREWIYSFNVPLFFFLSGFLFKYEISWQTFWKKNLTSIIIPYILYCILLNLENILNYYTDFHYLAKMLVGWILGFHSMDGIPGCLSMWFVYSLFLVRLLYQAVTNKRKRIILLIVCLICFWLNHYYGLRLKSSFLNISYAFPFFCLGHTFRTYNWYQYLENYTKKSFSYITVILCGVGTFLLSKVNGVAWTYECGGGQNLIYFFINAIVNIGLILWLSIILGDFCEKQMQIISQGSIAILAFHGIFVRYGRLIVVNYLSQYDLLAEIAFICGAALICLLFIPIIRTIKTYIPILIGNR